MLPSFYKLNRRLLLHNFNSTELFLNVRIINDECEDDIREENKSNEEQYYDVCEETNNVF